MKNKKRHSIIAVVRAALLVAIIIGWHTFVSMDTRPDPQNAAQAMESAYIEVTEGNDFATQVMRDAWDMSEFTDVSHYLNPYGAPTLLTNISLNDGTFSARATNARQSSIYPLFPGYIDSLLVGKIGAEYPIDPNKYKCFYAAAKVDSGAAQNGAPDQMVVFWFANEKLNGSTFGQTLPGVVLYPEAGAGKPTPRWKLYSTRLDQAQSHNTPWLNAPNGQWRGLRVDATLQETSFAFDWIRLTDCQPVPISLSYTGAGPVSVSIIPQGTQREILVKPDATQNPYVLDAQGLQVGAYDYIIRKGADVVGSGSFKVNPVPLANFKTPSRISGADFATQTGDPWDMDSNSDMASSQCMSTHFADGKLHMDTLSVEKQPQSCIGGWVPDPGVSFSTLLPINTSEYRYLSFRMFTEGDRSNFGGGMVVRWVWHLKGVSGLPANRCIMVSNAIPYDIGWYTQSIDMFDAIEGQAVQTSVVDCPAGLNWTNNSPAVLIRFDPNENISGQTMRQQLDWIRLTKTSEVAKGAVFPVELELNMPWSMLSNYQMYYTTDRKQPYQHPANVELPSPETAAAFNAPFSVFLPMITQFVPQLDHFDAFLPHSQTIHWNTAPVAKGTYYLCIKTTANEKSTTYCSEAPVVVK